MSISRIQERLDLIDRMRKGGQSLDPVFDERDVRSLLGEIERLATNRSKKERELEQELEVWRHGPACWTCGDTGDVHDITGEWRGECDCLAAQLINTNRERDQLKAEIERFRRYCELLEGDKKALTETHILYTWLRKKCDEPSNDVVAVHMNIGHDWAKVTDLDRDLRTMIEREEP